MNVQINQLAENDWVKFKNIRLRALHTDSNVFGSNYERESNFAETDWRERLAAADNAIFLLSDGETPIGVTCVSVDRNDPSGKTALLWGTWLAPEYRGRNLSNLMYRTRLEWAKRQPSVEKVIVSHRASNFASKFANKKHGFVQTHAVQKVWSDGEIEDEIFYELKV